MNEVQGKLDETNRTLNDFDAAKKKLSIENSDLLRQLEEAESQVSQLAKIKISLTTQLEDTKRLADEEGRVSTLMRNVFDNIYNTELFNPFSRSALLFWENSEIWNMTSITSVNSWKKKPKQRLISKDN